MITSISNDKVKHARGLGLKKNRQAHREFLVEGVRLIEEAERAGSVPALVFFDPANVDADERARKLVRRLRAHASPLEPVSPRVMAALAGTESPQGLVAVYSFIRRAMPTVPRLTLVLDALRDPGNLGTILRTAWAAGVDAVFLAPDTADLYNPKVVRAAMGAHFSLAVAELDWAEIEHHLRSVPRIYLADATAHLSYSSADWSRPLALIIGGEASGASQNARALATEEISIPMPGGAESLNAAVASGILLFQAIRSS